MSEYEDEVTSEDNTDQNNATDAESEEQETDERAEGKKIASILERKNKQIEELKARLANGSTGGTDAGSKTEQSGLSRAEAILFAKGYSEEEVDKAKKIAKLEGISDLEAIEDDLFKSWKKSNDDRQKSSKAQIGASSGSPKFAEKKGFDTKGLSDEDFKALWKSKMGR